MLNVLLTLHLQLIICMEILFRLLLFIRLFNKISCIFLAVALMNETNPANTQDMIQPKLVVFDLDYTLWPFWVDTHIYPPVKKERNKVVDQSGQEINYYNEVPQILDKLKAEGILMAVASRTPCISDANVLIELFNWNDYFSYKEIYPGSKVTHLNSIQKKSGIEFRDMLFFDDEARNIVEVSRLGVTSVLVGNGMSLEELKKGFELFDQVYKSHS